MKMQGVWLPIVTPFFQNEVDIKSYERLLKTYIDKKVSGFIPLGTTGESPVVETDEVEKIIETTVMTVNRTVPVFVGIGGNNTAKILKKLKRIEKYGIDGILSVCPYYNRPDQQGLYEHFLTISEATDLDIAIYNIPYRTGINLENDTLFRLAECANIVAVKDSCGDIRQSLSLLAQKPSSLSVLTGEDHLFYTTLVNGGNGGILASAHIETELFYAVYKNINENNHHEALIQWRALEKWIPLLFSEPNPAPVKFWLEKEKLIRSSETRLPLTSISRSLKKKLSVL